MKTIIYSFLHHNRLKGQTVIIFSSHLWLDGSLRNLKNWQKNLLLKSNDLELLFLFVEVELSLSNESL